MEQRMESIQGEVTRLNKQIHGKDEEVRELEKKLRSASKVATSVLNVSPPSLLL